MIHEYYFQPEDGFPDKQSPEEILRILDGRKTGDYAHIIPASDKQIFMLENGLPQAYGAVEEESPESAVTLWGPLFSLFQPIFSPPEPRTFGLLDIQVIKFTPAEIFIPKMTGGKFDYLSRARVPTQAHGLQEVIIDSFSGGLLSGKNAAGQRVTGGADFFNRIS